MTSPLAWPVDALTVDGEVVRQLYSSIVGNAGGLLAAGGLETTQKGVPSMAVIIKGGTPAEGAAWIPPYSAAAGTGPTFFISSANYEQIIATANASNPRIDTIVARIYDTSLDSSGKHEAVFEALAGTPETGASLGNLKGIAAVPKNCLVLSYVEVKAATTKILTENIKNVASQFSPSAAFGGLQTSAIATEQSRENTAYGMLATPDEVTVTVSENALIAVAFQATWEETVESAAKAALFIGANQAQYASTANVTQSQEAGIEAAGKTTALTTYSGGLWSAKPIAKYPGDSTTGQILGHSGTVPAGGANPKGNPAEPGVLVDAGGPCYLFGLAAGTYKISVQFKASSGKVTVKGRKLWAWVVA